VVDTIYHELTDFAHSVAKDLNAVRELADPLEVVSDDDVVRRARQRNPMPVPFRKHGPGGVEKNEVAQVDAHAMDRRLDALEATAIEHTSVLSYTGNNAYQRDHDTTPSGYVDIPELVGAVAGIKMTSAHYYVSGYNTMSNASSYIWTAPGEYLDNRTATSSGSTWLNHYTSGVYRLESYVDFPGFVYWTDYVDALTDYVVVTLQFSSDNTTWAAAPGCQDVVYQYAARKVVFRSPIGSARYWRVVLAPNTSGQVILGNAAMTYSGAIIFEMMDVPELAP
jgi:hypothetical protein